MQRSSVASALWAASRTIAAFVIFTSGAAIIAYGEAGHGKTAAPSTARWICDAYGHNARHWETVIGAPHRSKIDAQKSAISECSRKLTACSLSGCWHG